VISAAIVVVVVVVFFLMPVVVAELLDIPARLEKSVYEVAKRDHTWQKCLTPPQGNEIFLVTDRSLRLFFDSSWTSMGQNWGYLARCGYLSSAH